ncbi:MAG: DUF1731 domain-containing protein, partial [Clostridia bacterium]|nr:DUF1731 domain-containing protein [Clostridia bacterium]
LANVCKEWEKEAYKVKGDFTRVVTIRTGLVLGKEGALKRMALPFKYYIGGPLGSGLQWFSWIHIQDLTAMLKYIIENPCLSGPVNAVSPKAVRMKDFYRILGKVMNRPSWLPIPAFVLKLALGQLSEMLLTGQRVLPDKIMKAGFKHRYPELEEALENVSN